MGAGQCSVWRRPLWALPDVLAWCGLGADGSGGKERQGCNDPVSIVLRCQPSQYRGLNVINNEALIITAINLDLAECADNVLHLLRFASWHPLTCVDGRLKGFSAPKRHR